MWNPVRPRTRPRTPSAPWLLLALVALASLAPVAHADEHDAARIKQQWADERRQDTLDLAHDGFTYESVRDTDLAADRLEATFDLDAARFGLDFTADTPDGTNTLTLTLDDWALIEYEDLDGDGTLGLGEPVLQRHDAAATADPRLSRSSTGPITHLQATYDLPEGGEWHLVFHLTDRPAATDDGTLRPTQIKYDLQVERYPYTSDTSLLAIQQRVTASTDADADRTDLPRLLFAEEGHQAYLQWVDIATVDGRARDIETTVARAAFPTDTPGAVSESTVTFHYPRGDTIVHDPTLGVMLLDLDALRARVQQVLGSIPWLTVGIIAGIATVAVTLGPRLRRH